MDDLTTAAARGECNRVNSLLWAGVDPNGRNNFGRTPLQVMMMGSTTVALTLLRAGADPNLKDSSTGGTPLHDAARTGYLDTVKALVDYGADIQVRDNAGRRPIDLATENEHASTADYLKTLENSM